MIKNKSTESQLAMMKHLINYGKVEESAKKSAPVVEFSKKAANGKTYGIIRESMKYYIMEAPEKNTEILAEDFDYIGGFNNRKENEYSSYAKASNALTLKLKSINEVVDKDKRVYLSKPVETAEWETKITESMRQDIERFKTITTNAARILKEEKGDIIPSAHTLPEAPAKNPSDEKVNSPFTDTAVAKGDKDFKEKETDHTEAGKPYNEEGNSSEKGDAYTEKPEYVEDNNIADEHPSGGKVVRVETKTTKIGESRKPRLKLTLEQVLAWNDNKDYMDKSKGTEIGSSEPFVDEVGEESNQTEAPTEPIHENEKAVYNTDNQNYPETGTDEVGDGQPFDKEINEEIVPEEDVAGFDDNDEDEEGLELDIDPDEIGFEDDEDFDDEDGIEYELDLTPEKANKDIEDLRRSLRGDDEDDDYGYDDYDFFESYNRRGRRMNEDVMNDFGKHPAYQKVPMTTPPNKEVAINGAHEWDDESVAQEKPFGIEIGDSTPFDEIVDEITDAIVESYRKKKV